MDAPVDLAGSSRAELAAVIVAQRERIADLEREVAGLRGELATQQALIGRLTEQVGRLLARQEDGGEGDGPAPRSRRMPGLKPDDAADRPARPRRRRARGYGRARMTPTARQVHAYDRCPHCA